MLWIRTGFKFLKVRAHWSSVVSEFHCLCCPIWLSHTTTYERSHEANYSSNTGELPETKTRRCWKNKLNEEIAGWCLGPGNCMEAGIAGGYRLPDG